MILRVDEKKPLLVRWRYGLGRVIAFMSDAKSRWAAPWVRWECIRHAVAADGARRVAPRPQRCAPACVQEIRKAKRWCFTMCWPTRKIPRADTLGSAGRRISWSRRMERAPRTMPLEETAPGHYEARIPADQGGLYHIVSGNSEMLLPEAGFLSRVGRNETAGGKHGAARRDQPRHRRTDASVDRSTFK